MVTKVPAAMVAADVATQAELDSEASARTTVAGRVSTLENAVTGKLAGDVVQVVNVMSAAVATTTTTTADADSPPTTSHGGEFMTLAITPKSATNKLRIDVVANVGSSYAGANIMTLGLHQDATANAIAAVQQGTPGQNVPAQIKLTHYMAAGTTSETTFKVRIGGSAAGTTTFNGVSGGRKMGGVMASSITITEIKA